MKKSYGTNLLSRRVLPALVFLAAEMFTLAAQDTLPNGKALNFPFRKYGISIGNSYEFSGLRVNFADKDVRRVNGINVTLWLSTFNNQAAIVNGLSLGIIPNAGSMQPVNIGILGLGTAHHSNGLTIGGLVVGGDVNGIGLSGLILMADGEKGSVSGIAVSGIAVGAAKEINGIAAGGLIVGTDGDINGLAVSTIYIRSKGTVRGITLTPGYSDAAVYKGIAVSGFSGSDRMHGLSLALINHTRELHGVQMGLLNIARNNRKGLQVLPVINMHFRKRS